MTRQRKPYYTYSRSTTRGRRTYLGEFLDGSRRMLYNPDGTRCTNKSDADRAAARIVDAEHRTIVITVTHARHDELAAAAAEEKASIADYLLGLHDARRSASTGEPLAAHLAAFWSDGSAYIKGKAAAGEPLSASYVYIARSALRAHILPWLERAYPGLTVRGLRPLHLEQLKQHLVDAGLGPSRVNGILKAVRTPMGYLWRLEEIPSNPASKVPKLPDPAPERHLLTLNEARRFFEHEKEPRYATANLTAALAGLRMGEVRGLRAEDLREIRQGRSVSYELHVCHNWQDAEAEGQQLKRPKHSTTARPKERDVPVPAQLARALQALVARSPHGDGFVFWGPRAGTPLSNTSIEQRYRAVLVAIGISLEEQRRRHLAFHAWRHWYRSMLDAGGLSARAGDALTGHAEGSGIGKRYTHVTPEQRKTALGISERLLPAGTPAEKPRRRSPARPPAASA